MAEIVHQSYRASDNQSRPNAMYLNSTIDAITESGLGARCPEAKSAGAVTPDIGAHLFIPVDSVSVPAVGDSMLSISLGTYGMRAGQAWNTQQDDSQLCKSAPHYTDSLSCGVYEYRNVPANARTYGVPLMRSAPVDRTVVLQGTAFYSCYPTLVPPPNGTEIGDLNFFGTEFLFFREGTSAGADIVKPYGYASLSILSSGAKQLPSLLAAIPDGCELLEARCMLSAVGITQVSQQYTSAASTQVSQTVTELTSYTAQIVTVFTAGAYGVNLAYSFGGSVSGSSAGADCTGAMRSLYAARQLPGFIGWTILPTWSAEGLSFSLTGGDFSALLASILPTVTWYGAPYAGSGAPFEVHGAISDVATRCHWRGVSLSDVWVRYRYPTGVISEMQTPRDISAADSIGAPFPGFN